MSRDDGAILIGVQRAFQSTLLEFNDGYYGSETRVEAVAQLSVRTRVVIG